MKIKYFCPLIMGLMVLPSQISAFNYKPFSPEKGKTIWATNTDMNTRSSDNAEVVVNEDFSRFTQGSQDAPVPLQYSGYYLPDNMTAQPGWMGRGIAEADKACAIMYYKSSYGNTEGYLDTPEMYLYGTVTLSFRAKLLNSTSGTIWIPICDSVEGPMDSETFTLTNDWTTYTYTTSEASPYGSYFQFTPENCEVLLDEVLVSVVHDKVKAPYTLFPDNLSLTSFRANWESAVVPDYFLLNVYSKEKPQNFVEGEIEGNFDQVNVIAGTNEINQANPNYPQGWIVDATTVLETDGGSKAIVLSKEDQYIESPVSDLPINGLSFWVKPSNMKSESVFSMFQVSIFTNDWEPIANIPNYWLNENGTVYTFEPAAFGEGASKIRISYLQEGTGKVNFAFNDFRVSYQSAYDKVPLIEDLEIPGNANSYVVNDIVPEKNYYYTLKAVLNGVVSPASYPQWVDGINGIEMVALPAEKLGDNGFVAKWEGLPHAQQYNLRVDKLTTATTFMENVTVLEEDFNKITTGTLADPGSDFISPFNFGANGMANSDWMATEPRWIEGMAGSNGTSWYGSAGIVASPYITLTNDGGAFDVEFSALSIATNDEIFCMIIDDINSAQALEYASLQLGTAKELVTGTVHFAASNKNRSNIMVAFMSKSGMRFFIDDVRISQNLQPGESLRSYFLSEFVEGTSYEIRDLDTSSVYVYSVVALANEDFEDYESKRSNEVEVSFSAGVDQIAVKDNVIWRFDGEKIYVSGLSLGAGVNLHDLQGRKIASGTADSNGNAVLSASKGLYILKAGTRSYKALLK